MTQIQAFSALSKGQAAQLIQRMKSNMTQIGKDFAAFRDGKGWVALGYETLEACIVEELEIGKTTFYGMIAMSNVNAALEAENLPELPRQTAYALKDFAPDERATIVREAINRLAAPRGDSTPTLKDVQLIIQTRKLLADFDTDTTDAIWHDATNIAASRDDAQPVIGDFQSVVRRREAIQFVQDSPYRVFEYAMLNDEITAFVARQLVEVMQDAPNETQTWLIGLFQHSGGKIIRDPKLLQVIAATHERNPDSTRLLQIRQTGCIGDTYLDEATYADWEVLTHEAQRQAIAELEAERIQSGQIVTKIVTIHVNDPRKTIHQLQSQGVDLRTLLEALQEMVQ